MVSIEPATFARLNTRERIIEAARELFAEQGYAAASISKIAIRAGVKAGSIYWAFESKEALFAEVLRASAKSWQEKYISNRNPRNFADLRHDFMGFMKGFETDAELFRLMMVIATEHKSSPDLVKATRRIRNYWTEHLCDLITKIYPDKNPEALRRVGESTAELSLYLFDGMFMSMQLDERAMPLNKRVEKIINMLQHNLEMELAQLG